MNELVRALLLALGAVSSPLPATSEPVRTEITSRPVESYSVQARDAWLGPDKFRHFWASYAAVAFSYAGARALQIDPDAALGLSIGVGAAAGIAKEFYDRRHTRLFSVRDLVADALGLTLGYVMMRQVR